MDDKVLAISKRLANWIESRLVKIEILVLVFLALVFWLESGSISIYLLMAKVVLMLTIAAMYFLMINYQREYSPINRWALFFEKILWNGLCLSVLGILFKVQFWPGFDPMLMVGFLMAIVASIALAFQQLKHPEVNFWTEVMVARVLVVLAIGGFLYFTQLEVPIIDSMKNTN